VTGDEETGVDGDVCDVGPAEDEPGGDDTGVDGDA
jgi:hypothetical protein